MTTSLVFRRRPGGRFLVVLVMVVLCGLLGMHGLAPGAVPEGHSMVMAQAAVGEHVDDGCSHTSDHLDHADGTCAAAGIGSSYAPPTLSAVTLDVPGSSALSVDAPASAESGRAPPDLSELQLLRI
ncbi:DUF6153 family protein [Streptomyces antibioticus]|uniref:DUF6153 family protein n=1 Tax=Streptomyces antibioticus TaxID=1890 RepID=UPI0033A9522A